MAEVKTLTDAKREAIRKAYGELDKNGDGKIIASEMVVLLKVFRGEDRPELTEEQAKHYLRAMDYNRDGTVSLMEFEAMCAAYLGVSMTKHDLINYFKKFMKEGEECIKKDDLRSIMTAFTCGKHETIDEELEKFDKDGDGMISTKEFGRALPAIMGDAINYK